MGNFRQALLASFEHNRDSAQFELLFRFSLRPHRGGGSFKGTSLKIARAERFLRSIKWNNQNRTDFVPLHALRGSAPIRYAIVDGMTHPSLSRSSWQARSASIAPAVPKGATDHRKRPSFSRSSWTNTPQASSCYYCGSITQVRFFCLGPNSREHMPSCMAAGDHQRRLKASFGLRRHDRPLAPNVTDALRRVTWLLEPN